MAENKINVGGRLHSIATGNVLAGADEILYEPINGTPKKQSEVNVETYEHVASIDAALQELSPDQTEALALATDVNDLKGNVVRSDVQTLTDAQKAQTLANVGINGIDDEPTSGSDNLVKSGGVFILNRRCYLIPPSGVYINVTSTNITIPIYTRVYDGGDYIYRLLSAITVNRIAEGNHEVLLYNKNAHSFVCVDLGLLNTNSYPLSEWFYCNSLETGVGQDDFPAGYVKYNGDNIYTKKDYVDGKVTQIATKDNKAVVGAENTFCPNTFNLLKGHKYRFVLYSATEGTPSANFTFKVCTTDSASAVYTIAQLNGVSLLGNHIYETEWTGDTGTYRIGFYNQSSLRPIFFVSVSEITDVVDELSSNSTLKALSANQGKVLNDKIVQNLSIWEQLVNTDYDHWNENLPRVGSSNVWLAYPKMEMGKTYKVRLKIARTTGSVTYNNHIIVSKYGPGVPSLESSDYQSIASVNFDSSAQVGDTKEVTVDYTCTDNGFLYFGYWRQSGGGATRWDEYEINENNNISDKVRDIDSRVEEIEKDNIYFNNYGLALAAKKNGDATNKADRGLDKYLSICHITDVHTDWERVSRAIRFAEDMGSTLICTGDITLQSSGENVDGYNELIENYSGKYLHCVGNHDVWTFTSPLQEYEKWFEKYINDYNMPWVMPTGISNPSFFVYDDTDWNIRYIMLDQWRRTGTNDDLTPKYTQEQITFLVSSLQSVPSGYGVIVVMHALEKASVEAPEYSKFYHKGYMQTETVLMSPVSSIIDAFISKTSITQTFTSTNETISVDADFSNVSSNEFIAFICGHTHKDLVHFVPGTTNRQLVLCETCTTAVYSNVSNITLTESSDLARSENGENQDAFNIYVIDRENKTVRIVRIGVDMPYDFSERRDCMVIHYA